MTMLSRAVLSTLVLLSLPVGVHAQTEKAVIGAANTSYVGTAVNGSNGTPNPPDCPATSGGNGSSTWSFGTSLSTSGSSSSGTILNVSDVGGNGGNGGNSSVGGCVNDTAGGSAGWGANVANDSLVTITVNYNGTSSVTSVNTGIAIAAVGGDGGNGGSSNFAGSHGGAGGAGGIGGDITLNNYQPFSTTADYAFGIWIQTNGGAGGNGGQGSGGASGGSGGGGANGGTVTVNNVFSPDYPTVSPDITTPNGIPIFVQSIGGGGGNGGGGNYSGTGGNGGAAGNITILNYGNLTTTNIAGAAGIFAQSIGGGGGNAGFSGGLLALGGDGSTGGNAGAGGNVQINNLGQIIVSNVSSVGIFAQSIGGNGGNGGMTFSGGAGSAASIGGTGGGGGAGGEVLVYNSTGICTGSGCTGIDNSALISAGGAYGILAQSIGGGGGLGGFALSASGGITGSSVAVGGSGGDASNGGEVVVQNSASISTAEANSSGIQAQSIGGGGGAGGGSIAISVGVDASGSLSHGGSGGSGGDGGTVQVNCNSYMQSLISGCFNNAPMSATLYPLATITTGVIPSGGSSGGTGSPGILAQSVGGGGGSGGYSGSVSVSGGGSLALAFGGSGGSGGAAGLASASTMSATITTYGQDSPSVMAQSIGGGGGNGGLAITASAGLDGALSVSIGGSGGSGGAGSQAFVSNEGGIITTLGDRSAGLVAQSIGGGGGAGGSTIAAGVTDGVAVGISIGGSGATGGAAGNAAVYNWNMTSSGGNTGSITTSGYGSSAIVAQSIGGGGGSGGYSINAGVSLSGDTAGAGIGGVGGAGNTGANAFASNAGTLVTNGGGSAAILVQSIGGGGGTGGFTVTGDATLGSSTAIAIGGAGGDGASSLLAQVVNSGNITVNAATTGNAPAILAQSIGGSGGNGGYSVAGAMSGDFSATLALGGGGGTPGSAGPAAASGEDPPLAVIVNNSGQISTTGALSAGIVGQSMAGLGGNGGFAVAGSLSSGVSAAVSIGGGGGGCSGSSVATCGQAAGVEITSINATIVTNGDQSPGIVAQAMGGSGGQGGWDVSGALGADASAPIGIGGAGGSGGTVTGTICVIASAGSATNTCPLTPTVATAATSTVASIVTYGLLSPGVLAQSIGGNGGNGGFTAAAGGSVNVTTSVGIGGAGGDGGTAGAVYVETLSPVVTFGAQSPGILAQSIGGTGGNGGFALTGAGTTGGTGTDDTTTVSIGYANASGGAGGSGASAGLVWVSATGVMTQGLLSPGILAESIGGAGGNGGSSQAITLTGSGTNDHDNDISASITIGGAGGTGGSGNLTTVHQYGNIQTGLAPTAANPSAVTAFIGAYDMSPGIFAQSIGGAGGNGGAANSSAIAGSASLAIAVGGGGAVGGDADTVAITNNDNSSNASNYVVTYGALSPAVFGQSVGGGGGNGGSSQSTASAAKYTAGVAIGGYGAAGGNGGEVLVYTGGLITTYGAHSAGVISQSVGGGGGNGGAATSASTATGDAEVDGVSTVAGSFGGTIPYSDYDAAGLAPYDNLPSPIIGVLQNPAEGIAASLAIGGSAGAGGDGGLVVVESGSAITTYGVQSFGILAQSIGGGGGNGGASTSNATGDSSAVGIGLGGGGGVGGSGGGVEVYLTGAGVQTSGPDSPGVVAQSIGGGGGTGGASSNSGTGGQVGVSLALGGAGLGSAGGNGGSTLLLGGSNASQSIYVNTLGSNSPGMLAQLIGGGGGNASSSTIAAAAPSAVSLATAASANVGAVSGTAGSAGNWSIAGNTTTTNSGNGAQANVEGGISLGISLGGGSGGNAAGSGATDDMSVLNYAVIVTGANLFASTSSTPTQLAAAADNSPGLIAQAIGGGGGNAAVSTYNSATNQHSISMALGSTSAATGSGATVAFSNYAAVYTFGNNSSALVAQSIGGGGGNASASHITEGTLGAVAAALQLGGAYSSSTSGNTGGEVSVDMIPNSNIYGLSGVYTAGALSHGLLAQSIGGGGGAAQTYSAGAVMGSGAATFSASVADHVLNATTTGGVALAIGLGSDLLGGNGGYVEVTSSTSITTQGALSAGMLVQSIAGGGGFAGSATVNANAVALEISALLGGSATGTAGGVYINQTAAVATAGTLSYGIAAQSIGGGGGVLLVENSVASGTGLASDASTGTVTLGSYGSVTGMSDTRGVTVTADAVTTGGFGAAGILAQSIGGGGGAAGISQSATTGSVAPAFTLGGSDASSGSGDTMAVTLTGAVQTTGALAPAVIAQSIGGGGGTAVMSVANGAGVGSATLVLGASSTASGSSSGTVTVTADIVGLVVGTQGSGSYGILAQSIGGGGGFIGIEGTSSGGTVTLGGGAASGGGSGSGVTVDLQSGRSITTSGTGAVGVLAQSIGGGGGVVQGGSATSVNFGQQSGSDNPTGNAGGSVTVSTKMSITTSGTNAVGILAQSIGGGGGASLSDAGTVSIGTQATGGNAADVTVTVSAAVATTGAYADGVVAQSQAGGGGYVATSSSTQFVSGSGSGTSGTVTVNAKANVTATGTGSTAIKTFSTTDPIINIAPGVLITGGSGGTGIDSAGPLNEITNYGQISTFDGATGLAIRTAGGDGRVANGGVLLGNLSLAAGAANLVHNLASGTIMAGPSLDLGGTGVLLNDGTLQAATPGPSGTTISGTLNQSASGTLVVRYDQGLNLSDIFTVGGPAALSGTIRAVPLNPGLLLPGHITTPFITASGGLTTADLHLAGQSAILSYGLSGSGGMLLLDTTVNFTPSGLNERGTRIGTLVGEIQTLGSSPLFETIVSTLVFEPTVGALQVAYDTVGGSAAALVPQSTLGAASALMGAVTAQLDQWRRGFQPPPVAAAAALSDDAPAPGSRYMWGTPMGAVTTGGGLSGQIYGGTAGWDGELANAPVVMGAAVNLSQTALSASQYGASVVNTFGGAAVYGMGRLGPASLSMTGSIGYSHATLDRNFYGLGLNLATSSGFDSTVLAGRIEAGYAFDLPGMGAKITPFAAFQPMQVWQGAAGEWFNGYGGGLSYDASTITALPAFLGVQLDGSLTLSNGSLIAPFLKLAWMHDFSPDRAVSRSFAELPRFSFSDNVLPTISDAADVHAGVQFYAGANTTISVGFDGQLASGYSVMGASGTFRVRW